MRAARLARHRVRSPNGSRVGAFAGNPFLFLDHGQRREAELRSYILREHRRGRHLEAILDDPYVRDFGPPSLPARAIVSPVMIRALGDDIRGTIAAAPPPAPRPPGGKPDPPAAR